jgi:hypothetical protein
MTQITRIITHAGEFHADEVSAIALFAVVLGDDLVVSKRLDTQENVGYKVIVGSKEVIIERKFTITDEELADPSILVIDAGGSYDPELGNLDHHQDSKLSASNMLMMDYLLMMGEDVRILSKLRDLLFQRVSDVDLGVVKSLSHEYSSLIKGCANFGEALVLAKQLISNTIRNIKKSILDEERYNALPKVGRVAIQEDSTPILGWKGLAFGTGVCFLVCPSIRGGWNLISSDSDLYCIPESSNQIFRHNTGFMAVYLTKEEAVEAGTSFKVKFL